MTHVCSEFINRPINSYRPLACKPLTVQTRDIPGTGRQNKANYFFLMKPNTIREYATLDLLYPTPSWLNLAVQNPSLVFQRVVTTGEARVTTTGFLRVLAQ